MRFSWTLALASVFTAISLVDVSAQTSLTWAEVRTRFEVNNPMLGAGRLGLDESRADEVTAYLRPNPGLSFGAVQFNLAGLPDGTGHVQNLATNASADYLFERGGKRGLRRDSARGATAIATSTQADLVRTMTFTLRNSFVQLLQAKAFLTLAQAELADYDRVIQTSRDRYSAGDIAQIDLDRLTLQRVQYESDVQSALVNVRTAKIQLLALLNDRATPVEQFDVTGPYDFAPPAEPLAHIREIALDRRPDLEAAAQAVEKARVDHRLAVANGSTDPDISATAGWPVSDNQTTYVAFGVSIPLRIFDRNQGEKARARIDITRNERLADASRTQVLSDVDSAYATLESAVALLQPYKSTYLDQSTRVRDTMSFSYQNGGASLLDFLQAQQDFRSVQIAYVNLVASYLNAANQLNLAVGEEVIR